MMVKRRQTKTIKAAARTQAIVTSLFPKEIGKILIQEAIDDPTDSKENAWKKKNRDGDTGLQSMIAGDGAASKPLADLFPEATIMCKKYDAKPLAFLESKYANKHRFSFHLDWPQLVTSLASPPGAPVVNQHRSSCFWKVSTPLSISSHCAEKCSRSRQVSSCSRGYLHSFRPNTLDFLTTSSSSFYL